MTSLIQKHQKAIEKICREEGISYLAVFGSHARGDERPDSDIDLLVDYQETPGFIELYQTEEKFKSLFHKPVDLVTVGGLNKHLKPYVDQDLKILYERT